MVVNLNAVEYRLESFIQFGNTVFNLAVVGFGVEADLPSK